MAATPSFDEGRPRYLRELTEFLSIPSISADPARKPEMRQAAEWVAAQLAFANGRVVETAGHPVVLGEWLERAGCTDDPRLRPLRRAAARRRGRVGDAAVLAERPRRSHLCPRRDRRQGADARAVEGRRGVSRRTGRAAAQRPFPVRGRGGGRKPQPRRRSARPSRRARRGRGGVGGRRDVARLGALDRDRGERDPRARRRRHRPGHRPPLWTARRRCSESAARAGAAPRRPARAGRHGGRRRVLRRRPAALRRRPGGARARAVRRGGLPRRGRRAGAARRARASRRSSGSGRVRRSRSTAWRAEAASRSSRAGHGRTSRAGSFPTRTRPRSSTPFELT